MARSQAVVASAGLLLAAYGWLVRRTVRAVYDPAQDFYAPFERDRAAIIVLWHGEHFLVPFLPRQGKRDRFVPLTTHHRDGEIVTRAGMHLGLEKFLRGAGDHGGEFLRKKALQAFSGMLRELKSGGNVVVTADVPKMARVVGRGIVTLAKHSQCPIVPLAMATTHAYRLANWDRTCIHLPFGRMGVVRGEEIRVAPDADEAALETARLQVERALNDVTKRAHALAGSNKL
ncbi:MAG TPA: lysophospholipid acyltransferase family protein [Xanthobacteraceae bacterium]|nr:lysophospholipid acyltransferase family protein [Xanthobacteraceae bacterium]